MMCLQSRTLVGQLHDAWQVAALVCFFYYNSDQGDIGKNGRARRKARSVKGLSKLSLEMKEKLKHRSRSKCSAISAKQAIEPCSSNSADVRESLLDVDFQSRR